MKIIGQQIFFFKKKKFMININFTKNKNTIFFILLAALVFTVLLIILIFQIQTLMQRIYFFDSLKIGNCTIDKREDYLFYCDTEICQTIFYEVKYF
jgi:hypothetical protein